MDSRVLEMKSVGIGSKFDFVTRINAYFLAGWVENGYLQMFIQSSNQDVSRRKQSEPAVGSVVSFQLKGDE